MSQYFQRQNRNLPTFIRSWKYCSILLDGDFCSFDNSMVSMFHRIIKILTTVLTFPSYPKICCLWWHKSSIK